MNKKLTGIERCIELAGGQTELADKVATITGRPVSQQHVSYWKKAGYVAELYREAVSVSTNGEVTEDELRKRIPLLKSA